MADIFLDAHCFFDLIEKRSPHLATTLSRHQLHISVLSVHILIYVYKYKIPNSALEGLKDHFELVSLSNVISLRSLKGPTDDFEDNLQLHSALEAGCEVCITRDQKILNSKNFETLRITSPDTL